MMASNTEVKSVDVTDLATTTERGNVKRRYSNKVNQLGKALNDAKDKGVSVQITVLNAFEVELQQLAEQALTKNDECKRKYPDRAAEFDEWAENLKAEHGDVMNEIEKERDVSISNVETPTDDEHMVFTSPAEEQRKLTSTEAPPSWVSDLMRSMAEQLKQSEERQSKRNDENSKVMTAKLAKQIGDVHQTMKVQEENVEKKLLGLEAKVKTVTDSIEAAQKRQRDEIAKLAKESKDIQTSLQRVVESAEDRDQNNEIGIRLTNELKDEIAKAVNQLRYEVRDECLDHVREKLSRERKDDSGLKVAGSKMSNRESTTDGAGTSSNRWLIGGFDYNGTKEGFGSSNLSEVGFSLKGWDAQYQERIQGKREVKVGQGDRPDKTTIVDDEEEEPKVTAGGKGDKYAKLCMAMRVMNATKISVFKGDPAEYQRFKENFKATFPRKYAGDSVLIEQLREYVSDDVRQRVAECFFGNKSYDYVWERLDDEYSDTVRQSEASFNAVLDTQSIKPNDSKSLREFAMKLHVAVVALRQDKLESELTSAVLLTRLERKLPQRVLTDWVRYTECQEERPSIVNLSAWLYREVRVAELVERRQATEKGATENNVKWPKGNETKGKGLPSAKINAVRTQPTDTKRSGTFMKQGAGEAQGRRGLRPTSTPLDFSKMFCFVCDGQGHRLFECQAFRNMNPQKRRETVFLNGRCLRCLSGKGHTAKDCPKRDIIRCVVEGCDSSRSHHTWLHDNEFRKRAKDPGHRSTPMGTQAEAAERTKTTPSAAGTSVATGPPAAPGPVATGDYALFGARPKTVMGPPTTFKNAVGGAMALPGTHVASAYTGAVNGGSASSMGVLLKVVPVTVVAGRRSFETYAFLDAGAECTMIRSDVAKHKLGLTCRPVPMEIGGYDGESKTTMVHPVNFMVTSRNGTTKFVITKAIAVDRLQAARNPRVAGEIKKTWTYIKDIEIPEPAFDDVTVLIGQDVPAAHHYEMAVPAGPGIDNLYAYSTSFGWCMGGRAYEPGSATCFVGHIAIREPPKYDTDELVNQFWHIEANEVHLEHPVVTKDDRRAMEVFQSTARNIGDRYEVGLPWIEEHPQLPDNRKIALQRLFALERRFAREPAYAKLYDDVINEYVRLDHARLLSEQEAKSRSGKTWYLPHHGVVSKTSTTTKVRVVFDGAAECEGTSLNKHLLRGPNYLVSLSGVMLRYREHPVALGADIEKMYHQVRVREEDKQAYRFVYRAPGNNQAPRTYEMQVHVFGSKPSPAICMYVLNKTADDNAEEFPEAAAKVRECFYVDNYLESFPTEEEAVKRARQMKELMRRGGFNLTKWTSASKGVLTKIASLELAKPEDQLDLEALPIERTLGILWDREVDAFTFKPSMTYDRDKQLTKRECLSIIMSIFDPLGLVAPVVIGGKLLLKEVWADKTLGYDDVIPIEQRKKFFDWCEELSNLSKVKVPRCFLKHNGELVKRTLHVFTDASQVGYGAAAYVRNVFRDGVITVAFVMAKAHVAPSKGQTIPRLELEGAVEGMKLAINICKELKLNIQDVLFHTDSQTVLRWLNSKDCKFEVFVANRVGKILNNTEAAQWHHVPGVNNPADACSRGIAPQDVEALTRFHEGSEFLRRPPEEWPRWEEVDQPFDGDPEVVRICAIKIGQPHPIDEGIKKFSSQLRLQRVVAWCKRYVRNLRAGVNKSPRATGELTVNELEDAITTCLRRAHEVTFPEEVECLRKGRPIPQKSILRSLNPFLCDDGVVHVGGRVQNAPIAHETKHPIVLHGKHRLTRLLIRQVHQRNCHAKSEHLFTLLRQKYWVLSGRTTVRTAIGNCLFCRIRDSKPCTQIMAPLPVHRVTAYVPPFCHAGVDFFGPVLVKMGGRGRRQEKRWVAVFTCLNTRAIHLEIAESLSAETFLSCMARFSAVRGKPRVMYSDNGLNFVGAEREMRQEWEALGASPELQSNLANYGIEWHFSPPHAPHFGGVWERMVQSCKRALVAIVGSSIVAEPVLRTALHDVMSYVNSRPLTHLSIDPNDPEPLTPNHFLFGRPMPYSPIKPSDLECANVGTRQYEQAQQLSFQVWRRFLKEYVPNLNARDKWEGKSRDVQVGDFVLVIDDNTPKGEWPKGRIVEVCPNKTDGHVRSVKVMIMGHSKPSVRPISRLRLLYTNDEMRRTGSVVDD